MYSALGIRYKNSAGVTETTYPVRYIGEGDSNGYDASVLLGSTNGTTVVGAGESSVTMPAEIGAYDNESIYLIADGQIHGYVGCANDASSYTKAFQITSATTSINNRVALGKNPILYATDNYSKIYVLPEVSFSTLGVSAGSHENYMKALL